MDGREDLWEEEAKDMMIRRGGGEHDDHGDDTCNVLQAADCAHTYPIDTACFLDSEGAVDLLAVKALKVCPNSEWR
jgi:hypothetical protein